MKIALAQHCIGRYEVAAYVSGAVYAANKRRIEQHLSACHSCFEIFIDAFNQYLEYHRESYGRLGQNDVSNSRNLFAQTSRAAGQDRTSPQKYRKRGMAFLEKCDLIEERGEKSCKGKN